MRLLTPDVEVVGIYVGYDDFSALPGSDVVFIQTVMAGRIAADYPAMENLLLRADLWGDNPPEFRLVPTFQYLAFHPDLTYAWIDGRETLKSPLGDYNSALVIQGWLGGLSAAETEALFCEPVYRHLGYHARRTGSDQALLQDSAFCGIDLAPFVAGWGKEGCYCHTTNHPKLRVLSSYARSTLELAGFPMGPAYPEHVLPDTLVTSGTWPVYPGIADGFGMQGDLQFHPPHHGSGTARPPLPLREFIERSLAIYGRIDPDRVTISRSAVDCQRFAELASLPTWPAGARPPR